MIKKIVTGKYAGMYMVRTSAIDENNTRHFSKRFYLKSYKEAQEEERKLLMQYDAGYTGIHSNTPLYIWFEQWYQSNIEPYLETNSKSDYHNLISRLKKDIPTVTVGDFDSNKQRMQEYFNSLGLHYSKNTVKKYRSYLQRAFSDAEYDGIIRKTPMPKEHGIRITGTDDGIKKEVSVLNMMDTDTLRAYLYTIAPDVNRQEHLMLLIMLECGLRPHEAKALEFQHIDFFRHMIHVQNVYIERDNSIKPYPKNRTQRDVPISDQLESVLHQFIPAKQTQLKQLKIANPERLLFRSIYGDKILSSSTNTKKVFQRALVASGIPRNRHFDKNGRKLTPKSLRATHDSLLISKGISLDYIARISGHTVEVINQYYRALLDETATQEAEKVKQIWS